ncbi:hypothetical protein DLAC_00195 [Tieghemostelium lacteum]|uniref:WAP domain-containing protein n=1 Tax=Tieghemostelium lacteum TaxID=361077 RepID=A0A152A934_TIELA|nr:hypothetical protein DLAC_00195 [Tieghemostelium lacteum]|eukprot:KYR02730.1 hypothetical protein DLAC_00195 [Tieghemostelium lacteum]
MMAMAKLFLILIITILLLGNIVLGNTTPRIETSKPSSPLTSGASADNNPLNLPICPQNDEVYCFQVNSLCSRDDECGEGTGCCWINTCGSMCNDMKYVPNKKPIYYYS